MTQQKKPSMKKVAFASMIGATVEWYDFLIFGLLSSLVFKEIFFKAATQTSSLMYTFLAFSAAYLSRPFGALIFGHFGDRLGRKKMLVITILIMGITTFLIGFVPPTESIGLWAPAMIYFLRTMQGLGLGGEWGGAVLLAYEHADPKDRAFYTSFPQMGQALALVMSASMVLGLQTFFTPEDFLAWGWRIAFWSSAILVVIALYIRLNIIETPAFEQVLQENHAKKRAQQLPVVAVFRRFPRNILMGVGCRWIEGVSFNVLFVVTFTYMQDILHLPAQGSLIPQILAGILMCPVTLYAGRLADKIGAGTVFGYAALAVGVSVYPCFWVLTHYAPQVIATGDLVATIMVWAAIIVPFGIFYAAIYATMGTLFSSLFSPDVRYTGISVVAQFPGYLVSGIVPMLCIWLLSLNDNDPLLIGVFVLGVSAVSAISAFAIQRGRFGEFAKPVAPDVSDRKMA